MNRTLEQRVDAWLASVGRDAECRAATRQLDLHLTFDFGDFERDLHLESVGGETPHAATVRLTASPALWREILAPVPKPGYHSFTALQRQTPQFVVEATALDIARALHALERIVELARPSDALASPSPAVEAWRLDRVTGRYRVVTLKDTAARLYYEQAGEGPALVMLHTAGADSRQYLDLLVQTGIADHWSCYAFDMPLHGRSSPPDDWQWGEYRLTMSQYVDWCLAFIEQVAGRPCVVVGCSMGASIGVALAATGSPWVRAVAAVEAPDKSPGRRNAYLSHPCVDSADYSGAYVRGLMSPTSRLDRRRYASWIYAQGGPGIYPGDLWFYSEEYDGLALAPKIDTQRCPVYLLTGAYDYSAPPAASRRLSRAIAGARLTVMPELGHFPMTENPIQFYGYLAPVLEELKSNFDTHTSHGAK